MTNLKLVLGPIPLIQTPAGRGGPIREGIAEAYKDVEIIFLDPSYLDVAITGVAERINFGPVVVYDREKIVKAFVEAGMDEEGADKWISFSIEGAYMGQRTPLILCPIDKFCST